MTEPTVARPDIDPVLKMLLDTFPVTFTAADGVEVARARLRQLKTPPELLPELRIEERTVGYDGLTDIPVRVYWPPVVRDNLPVPSWSTRPRRPPGIRRQCRRYGSPGQPRGFPHTARRPS